MRTSVAGIAQLVEQLTCNQKVPSSTLGAGTNIKPQSQDWGFFYACVVFITCASMFLQSLAVLFKYPHPNHFTTVMRLRLHGLVMFLAILLKIVQTQCEKIQ